MRNVADALGISQAAVSLALRNSAEISEKRRLEIQSAAQRLGYVPNAAAISLSHFKHSTRHTPIQAGLAWLTFSPDAADERATAACDANWRGAVEAARSLGYSLEEFNCDKKLPPCRLAGILAARGMQGIVLPQRHGPLSGVHRDFDWSRFATIRIGYSAEYPPVHLVCESQARDTLLAIDKMREKGYRRIGHITTRSVLAAGLFDGAYFKSQYCAGEKGLPLLVLKDHAAPEEGDAVREVDAWMKAHRPEAILTAAPNTRALLETAGYCVPRDVAVAAASIGQCDVDAGMSSSPGEVGRIAISTLVRLVQRNEVGIPDYPVEILVRGKWTDGGTLPPAREPSLCHRAN